MKYVCLIYGDEVALQKMSKEEMGKLAADSKAFHEALQKSGQFVAFHGMTAPHTATTVSVREGKTLMTDGPFIETKELLGSILVIEAKDLNDAIRVASKIPSARIGSIEVRPTWEWQ
ncbi:MAG: YciI family protein [Anaerolineae bacterium]